MQKKKSKAAEDIDHVFVITPQLDLNMNLLKWMRLNVGVGYRIVTGVDHTYKTQQDGIIVEKPYFDSNAFNSITGNSSTGLSLTGVVQPVILYNDIQGNGSTLLSFSMVLFLTGFGIKAAMIPFHAWLPDAHPSAPYHLLTVEHVWFILRYSV